MKVRGTTMFINFNHKFRTIFELVGAPCDGARVGWVYKPL